MHSLNECPQNSTIERIEDTLERLEKHGERTAVALEVIASQVVRTDHLEKRVDKHDEHFNEAFNRLRVIENKHAKESGAEAVERKQEKFWTEIRLKLFTPITLAAFFILWVLDKMDAFQWLLNLIKEFKK